MVNSWRELKKPYKSNFEDLLKLKPHEIFRINETYTEIELKEAYRKLVKSYHPDGSDEFMSMHNEEIMKILNSAYVSLKDKLRNGKI